MLKCLPAVIPPYLEKRDLNSDDWQLLGSPRTATRRWQRRSVSELEVILFSQINLFMQMSFYVKVLLLTFFFNHEIKTSRSCVS